MADDRDARIAELEAEVARLRVDNTALTAGRASAQEQQAAMAEVLHVIAASPTDLQTVLDTVARHAVAVCGADDAQIFRTVDGMVDLVAHHGPLSTPVHMRGGRALDRTYLAGRAMLDQRTFHIDDYGAIFQAEFPETYERNLQLGSTELPSHWTILSTPLIREGVTIGAITVRRVTVRPFSDRQIALLQTFADQAVVAIENARLFEALQESNRQVTEALEQQTATGEILSLIASSPTDVQPVLDAVAERAARLCGSYDAIVHRVDGDVMPLVARFPPVTAADADALPVQFMVPPSWATASGGIPVAGSFAGRAVTDRRTIHIHDAACVSDEEYPIGTAIAHTSGQRTTLATPMLRHGVPIGVLLLRSREVRPFTEQQIAVLEAFADQAVIAIENARLFEELEHRNRELTQALDQQTATAEVLRIIASAPTDLAQVLDALVRSVCRLTGADAGSASQVDGEDIVFLASTGAMLGRRLPADGTVAGHAVQEARTMHVYGTPEEQLARYPNSSAPRGGLGGQLVTPLLRRGEAIGTLNLVRQDVRPFTEQQIALLETFADQAVIAIENARLFEELERRNAQLHESNRQVTEALEQQTATIRCPGLQRTSTIARVARPRSRSPRAIRAAWCSRATRPISTPATHGCAKTRRRTSLDTTGSGDTTRTLLSPTVRVRQRISSRFPRVCRSGARRLAREVVS